jgi:hypothetical protein
MAVLLIFFCDYNRLLPAGFGINRPLALKNGTGFSGVANQELNLIGLRIISSTNYTQIVGNVAFANIDSNGCISLLQIYEKGLK